MAAAASVSRRSCWGTSPTSTGTSARTRTRASGSGAISTTRRTRGAPTPKITLNYGLRLDVINPQTVNEAGNGGWLDLRTGEILIGGVGDVDLAGNVKNRWNWAPRVGATYQIDEKTVIRGGYGRTYDIGVFGSLFGHSVTQNLPVLSVQQINAPSNFDRVFTLAQGPPDPTFQTSTTGHFPLKDGVFTRALPPKQRPPMPWTRSTSPCSDSCRTSCQSRSATSAIAGACSSWATVPDVMVNDPTLQGFPTVPRDKRRPFFAGLYPTTVGGYGGAFDWTQGIQLLLQLRAQLVRLAAGALQPALQGRVLVPGELHVAEGGAGRRVVLLLRP